MIHRHKYKISGYWYPHAFCMKCRKVTYSPKWPWWKKVKE